MQVTYTEEEGRKGLLKLKEQCEARLIGLPFDIKAAIADREWRYTVTRCTGVPLGTKFSIIQEYFSRSSDETNRAVRISNYVDTLQRIGVLRDE